MPGGLCVPHFCTLAPARKVCGLIETFRLQPGVPTGRMQLELPCERNGFPSPWSAWWQERPDRLIDRLLRWPSAPGLPWVALLVLCSHLAGSPRPQRGQAMPILAFARRVFTALKWESQAHFLCIQPSQ